MAQTAYSLCPEILKKPTDELKNDISKIRESGYPGSIPLIVLVENTDTFIYNLKKYPNKMDPKEAQREFSVFCNSKDIMDINESNMEGYKVNLQKANGKAVISPLAQNANTLISKLDLVIDAGEEEILDYNSEFLAKDVEGILSRIEFCKINGIDYRERDKENPNKFTKYKAVIASPLDFEAAVGEIELVSKDNKKTNQAVADLASNKELVIALENNNSQNSNQAADGEDDLTYYSMLQSLEGKVAKTNRAYILAGMSFSIKRVERNLKTLLKNATINDTSMDEIFFVAMTYNSYKTEEEVKEVASALGFNNAMGGVTL